MIWFDREVVAALIPALEHHLLFEAIHGDRHIYQFPHDRVHEAAYALLPESERARVHLEIGRRLLASTTPEALPETVFEIVSQLDRGAALIEARHERERIAELHLLAGTRAQDSTAYASALYYFTAGAELLAADLGIARPELAFALELHRAQCELMTSAFGAAEQRLAELAHRAADLHDLAAVTLVRIALYTALDRAALAVEATLEYLRRVGIDWPAHPTDDDVRREHDRIWQQLGSRAIEELADLPPMTDPQHRATMDVLTVAQSPVLHSDVKLHSLVICRMVNLSLEHGNSDGSGVGYTWLGAFLRPRFGNPGAGIRFGQVGLDLVERRGLLRWKARVYLDFGIGIASSPWLPGAPALRRSARSLEDRGELHRPDLPRAACHRERSERESIDRDVVVSFRADPPVPPRSLRSRATHLRRRTIRRRGVPYSHPPAAWRASGIHAVWPRSACKLATTGRCGK